jgi:hypothetical protein
VAVYDVEALIENIKRRCAVPTSQITYTDQDFTDLANDELHDTVVPLLLSTREEYFVEHEDISTPADRVIPIPENAVGSKLRSVCYMQATSPLTLINLPRIDLDVVAGVGFANYDTLAGFYVEGNNLVLYPNTSVPVNTNIRLYFYRRTLVLASPAQYGQVLSIDTNANTVVLDFVPNDWAADTVVNSISNLNPFKITNSEMVIQSVSSPTLFLDTVEGIVVGDYISLQGYSGVAQVPVEAQAYLAQLTAAKCLEGLGDTQGMENAMKKAMEMQKNLLIMVTNRVDGSPKKIVNPDGGLRVSSGLWRRGWGAW